MYILKISYLKYDNPNPYTSSSSSSTFLKWSLIALKMSRMLSFILSSILNTRAVLRLMTLNDIIQYHAGPGGFVASPTIIPLAADSADLLIFSC